MPEETLAKRASRTLHEAVEAVRREDTMRNRAIMKLAKFHAERVGYSWDSLPWRGEHSEQFYYVMHAMQDVDTLIEAGFIDTQVPPEATAYYEAHQEHGRSFGAQWAD